MNINIANSFINKNRISLIQKICGEESKEKIENALNNIIKNIMNDADDKTYKLMQFIYKLDNLNNIETQNLSDYTQKDKTIHVINTQEALDKALISINKSKIIGFDTEQKPIFKKGVPPSKIAIIQISDNKNTYVIQVQQIKDISSLLGILVNENITKVGIGLNGDYSALYNEFKININACIDFGSLFKQKMSFSNEIGAKRGVMLFLNQNLQKSKKISRSNWENEILTDSQIKYASEDASCVYDMFCQMLKDYPFLIEILPTWFQDKYINTTF